MDATARRQITEYPTPPTAFVVTLDVQRLYNCYKDYLRTRIEGLLSVAAYKCLKKLEHLAGRNKNTRRAAARKYAMCFDVLNELARLVNKYGGPVGSRKDIDTQPYTQEQKAWI